VQRTV